MTCKYLVAVMITSIFIMILAFGIALLYLYNKHKKILENITEYEIDVNATINEEIPKVLELFVKTVFDDYRVKNLEAREEFTYINSKEEMKITQDVATLCAQRLSPAMVHKLSLFWNAEMLGSVIADKVYLVVVAYVAANNSAYNEDGTPKE